MQAVVHKVQVVVKTALLQQQQNTGSILYRMQL